MTMKFARSFAPLIIVAVLFAVPAVAADDPAPTADPPAGDLLIASAQMQDPRFRETVILLLRHDSTGAFGIVINRPLGERLLADVLAQTGTRDDTGDAVEGTIGVFLGGPVQPELGFVVHSGEYRRPETLVVGDQLAMTASREALRDIGRGKGPAKYFFALGYAGWGAGQLEGEIARHAWFTAPAEPGLVFDSDRSALWEMALARREREL
jgi:putative transcriptional regulator